MYEKQLISRKVLYFKHAPPITGLDDVSVEDRPNAPYHKAPPHKRSVYYYWWAFLRENKDYIKCCERRGAGPMSALYEDFGDIRSENFMAWWKRGGRDLFCEPPEDQIISYITPPIEHDNDHRVLLSIPITGDIERTFAELRQLLKPIYRVAKKHNTNSRARYKVHSKAVVSSLHQHLVCWQETQRDPDVTHGKIAEMIGSDSDSVRRYIRQAKVLIRNVGEGRFPDFGKAPKRSRRASST